MIFPVKTPTNKNVTAQKYNFIMFYLLYCLEVFFKFEKYTYKYTNTYLEKYCTNFFYFSIIFKNNI